MKSPLRRQTNARTTRSLRNAHGSTSGYFGGSERDVLSRYAGAADAFGAGPIVALTPDRPSIHREVIDEVVVDTRGR